MEFFQLLNGQEPETLSFTFLLQTEITNNTVALQWERPYSHCYWIVSSLSLFVLSCTVLSQWDAS